MIGEMYKLFLVASLIGLASSGSLAKRRDLLNRSPSLESPGSKMPKISEGTPPAGPGSGGDSMLGLERYKILPYGDMFKMSKVTSKLSKRAIDTQTGEVVMIRCQRGRLQQEEMQQSRILQDLNRLGSLPVPRWLGTFRESEDVCTVLEYPNGVLTSDLGGYDMTAAQQQSALKAIIVALEQLPWIGGPSHQLLPTMAMLTKGGVQFLEFKVIKIEKPGDYSFASRALQRMAKEMFDSSTKDQCCQSLLEFLDRSEPRPFANWPLSGWSCLTRASENLWDLLGPVPLAAYELFDPDQAYPSVGPPDSCQAYRQNGEVVDVDTYVAESLRGKFMGLSKIIKLDYNELIQKPLDVLPWGNQVDVIYASSLPSVTYFGLSQDQPAQLTRDVLDAIQAAVVALSFLHQNGLYLNAAHPEDELEAIVVYESDTQRFKLRPRPDRLLYSLEGRMAAAAVEHDLLTLYHYVNRLRGLCPDLEMIRDLDGLLSKIAELHEAGDFDGVTKLVNYLVV